MGEHLLCTQGVASSILVASTPGKGGHRNVSALSLLLAGCVAQRVQSGLVLEDKGQTFLVVEAGKRTRLDLDGENVAIEQLLGCRVSVEGAMGRGALKVERYTVLDSGYGARPHVGWLNRSGGVWTMEDRNTGTRFEFVSESMGGLAAYEGDLVLVDGVVVGPHQVRVMSYRVLLDVP